MQHLRKKQKTSEQTYPKIYCLLSYFVTMRTFLFSHPIPINGNRVGVDNNQLAILAINFDFFQGHSPLSLLLTLPVFHAPLLL